MYIRFHGGMNMGKTGILLATMDYWYGSREKENGKKYTFADKEKDILGDELFQILMGNVNSSQQSKNRTDGDAAKGHYEEIAVELKKKNYREQMLERWKERLAKPHKNFSKLTEAVLDDDLYRAIVKDTDEYKLVKYLSKFSTATESVDQAQFMTTVTLMSITRHHWHEVVSCLLPEDEEILNDLKTEEEIAFETGKAAYDAGNYKQALEYFENSWYPEGTNDVWSGNVFYMIACSYRLLMENATESEIAEGDYENCYKDNLEDACRYSNLAALLKKADELCGKVNSPVYEISYDKAVATYKKVINLTNPDMCDNSGEFRVRRGEAFWKLYLLIFENNYNPSEGESALYYLKKAKECGHPQATEQYIQNKESDYISLTDYLEISEDLSEGIFLVNDQNSIIRTIITQTKPLRWTEIHLCPDCEVSDEAIDDIDSNSQEMAHIITTDCSENVAKNKNLTIFSSYESIFKKYSSTSQKYFFVHDDFSRNLSDFMELLQTVRGFDTSIAKHMEIFIRGNEEKVSPIVDTALSHIDDFVCPIHIIDDDKLAARVLARHPLFYSIRNLEKDENANLHYVILGSSPCCQWLLREAFWMLTFRNTNIKTYITLIAPDAEDTLNRILYQCPGMEPATTDHSKRMEDSMTKSFPFIQAVNLRYDSIKTIERIREILNDNNAYFSIDIGNDIDNMNAAIRIREEVLNIGIGKNNWKMIDSTAITFKCKDPNVCVLSRNSIVLIDNRGDAWNTNYAIIPFGNYDVDYQWDTLANNIYDRMGFNIHLQYYYGYEMDISENDANYKGAYADFWGKTYNRDSSISVALSMPYRLFQVDYRNKGPILPSSDWKITDQMTYCTENAMKQFANQYPESRELRTTEFYNEWTDLNGNKHNELSPESHTLALAKWEKERWNRFMLSRGWRSAPNSYVSNYYEAGNLRHQLYIGKLHPCITTYDKLVPLESFWKGKSGVEKNFRQLDISNLEMTKHILQMEWTRSLERNRGKVETKKDLRE